MVKNGKILKKTQNSPLIFSKIKLFTIIDFMATQHKQIDAQTLENLLYLSRLSPESTNMETLKKQVDDIVGYFDILSKYDDSENPYDAYPTTTADALRDDTVVEGLDMPDVKKVSKDFMDGYFQVPKVLGEGA
jgi:aspartyl-tRNA(Asn)/glutamyl-tRNA(Gln) amidotransferase subunit C